MPDQTIHALDPKSIRVFISRARNQEEHARAVRDTKRRGQIMPGKVRDIRHLPKEERKRPGGGYYDFQLVYGEGRLLRARELGRKFLTKIDRTSELESVGEFLSENLNREPLPWATKARLVQPLLQAGRTPEQIADELSLTPGHVLKFKRILDKTAAGLEEEVAAMDMNDAEALTALPAGHQTIVMEEFRETKPASVRELVKFARKVTEKQDGELSKTALRKSLERLDEDLRRVRDRLKLLRLHHSLGPANLALLLDDRKFRAALRAEGVNTAKFEKVSDQ